MQSLLQNMRYALRQLAKSPGFTFTVVLTLALGIGATAAIFTLFDQVLLRMLPVQQPQQLVRFEFTGFFSGSASSFGGTIKNYFSYPMYKDLRDKSQVFTGILAADKTSVGVSWNDQAENSEAEVVTGNYFDLLGLKPALGRLFTPIGSLASPHRRPSSARPSASTAVPSRSSASRRKTSRPPSAGTSPASSFPRACLRSPCPGWFLATISTTTSLSG
jgi:hypothetical protein